MYVKLASCFWKFPLDVDESIVNTFFPGDIQRNGVQTFRADLLQLRFSLLRQTSGKHVTSQLVESLRYQVSKPSVTSGDEDVTIGVTSHSWDPDEAFQHFIRDEG